MRILHRASCGASSAHLCWASFPLSMSVRLQGQRTTHGHRPSAVTSSSPSFSSTPPLPAAPPGGQLMPAFSPELYGYHRGARGAVQEPMDVWLALLSDAVPFYKDSLVMVPRQWPRDRQRALWRRAAEHLPGVHLGMLPEISQTAPAAAAQHAQAVPPQPRPTTPATRDEASQPTALTRSSVPSALSSSVPPTVAPPTGALDRTVPHSLDIIVLASNLFGDEMLFHAPWYISMAHRALKPHGVLALFGHSPRLRVSAPTWADDDVADYLADLSREARETARRLRARLSSVADHARQTSPTSDACVDDDVARSLARARDWLTRLEQAQEIEQSQAEGHQDVYLPFRGVQRRWFTAEYAMTPTQLVALIRAMPLYQLLHEPGLQDWLVSDGGEQEAAGVASQTRQEIEKPGDAADDIAADVVVTPLIERLFASAAPSAEAHTADRGGLHVRRQRENVDGLEVLESYLKARLHQDRSAEDAQHHPHHHRRPASASLRVQIQFFVVTCSSRSMNSTGSFDRFRAPPAIGRASRLPATRQ